MQIWAFLTSFYMFLFSGDSSIVGIDMFRLSHGGFDEQ